MKWPSREGLRKKEVCLVGSEATALGEQGAPHWLGACRCTKAVFQSVETHRLAHLAPCAKVLEHTDKLTLLPDLKKPKI